MHASAAGMLLGGVVAAAVGLTAVAGHGAAVEGLTADHLLGGPPTPSEDGPIKTSRWSEDAPPVPLAPPAHVDATPVASNALTDQPPAILIPPPSLTQAAFRARRHPAQPRMTFAVGDAQAPEVRALGQAFAVAAQPGEPARFDARRLLVRIGPAPRDRKQGRWFIFAAGSGDAFGLNMIKDPVRGGWRRAGWSVERLAEYGKAQVGVGWRRGDAQVALSAARREIAAYGVSREDTVVGVTFTVSGKPPAKTRFEQRLPRR